MPSWLIIYPALIGDGFKKDAFELKKLDDSTFTANMKILHRLLAIKDSKKQELADYLKETQDIDIDPKSIFDIQVKRLHEYKRQQMDAPVPDTQIPAKSSGAAGRPLPSPPSSEPRQRLAYTIAKGHHPCDTLPPSGY
ncbi:MAG: glycogen/starch/alpha-glucan phosphorylase [Enterocloster clostridioformis]